MECLCLVVIGICTESWCREEQRWGGGGGGRTAPRFICFWDYFFCVQADAAEADHPGDVPAAAGGGPGQGRQGCQVARQSLLPCQLLQEESGQGGQGCQVARHSPCADPDRIRINLGQCHRNRKNLNFSPLRNWNPNASDINFFDKSKKRKKS